MKPKVIKSYLSAAEIHNMEEANISHPLNENSDVFLKRLAPATGLNRMALYIARVPPKKESFAYHYHERDEEFIYVLEGRGVVQVGEDEIEIGPGDFLGFTAPGGPGHHILNPFDEDLVYLMGGESSGFDIGHFPKLGKKIIFSDSSILSVDEEDFELLSWGDWKAQKS